MLISAETILGTSLPQWFSMLVGAIAVTLAYLLLRLLAGFAQTPPWVRWLGGTGLATCILALVFTPAPSPPSISLLLAASFVATASYDTTVFMREATRSSGVTQRRMQTVALGSFALAGAGLAAVLATFAAPADELWTVVSRVLALGSGLAYYVGFGPSGWLRRVWQTSALKALLEEITRLPHLPDLRAVRIDPAGGMHVIAAGYSTGI